MRLAAPATLVDVNAAARTSTTSSVTDDGVRVGALARHADLLAHEGARGGAAAAGDGALARRPRDDPQPRDDRRLDRPRRRRGRDARRAGRCSAARSRSRRCAAAAPSPRPTCSPGRWSRRWPPTSSPLSAFVPGAAAGGGGRLRRDRPPPRRLRAVRGRRPGPGRGRRGRRGDGSATSRSTTSRRSSTSPASTPDEAAERRADRARPRRRHPRDGGLPRPAGAGAHPPGAGGRDRDARPDGEGAP